MTKKILLRALQYVLLLHQLMLCQRRRSVPNISKCFSIYLLLSKYEIEYLIAIFFQPTRKLNRYSVLKVIDQMEAEISPCTDKNSKGGRAMLSSSDGGATDINSKKRRKSRVSFGNIQTAIFQKDSEWTSPSSSPSNVGSATVTLGAGRVSEFLTHVTNLSTLPDDSAFGSPASVAMETTAVVTAAAPISSLPSLPPLSDLSHDGSMASFGDQEAEIIPSVPMSLMDLVADDEQWGTFNEDKPLHRNTFTASMEFINSDSGLLVDSEKMSANTNAKENLDAQPADVTNHDLTADIPAPGNRTRAFANHTGAFDVSGAFGGSKSGPEPTVACGMELTTAFGGIVQKRPASNEASEVTDATSVMDFTTAYGGIVRGNQHKDRSQRTSTNKFSLEFSKAYDREFQPGETDAVQELTEKLAKIKSAASAKVDEPTELVAMDMTGTFGRIVSAISSAERDDEPLSSPKAVANAVTSGEMDGTKPFRLLEAFTAQMDGNEETRLSPEAPLASRTRSRSRTPTKALKEKSGSPPSASQSRARRRSSRGATGTRPESMTLDTFLEEMGVRFLTNARSNKRKSSIGSFAAGPRLNTEITDNDRLRQVTLFPVGPQLFDLGE